MALTPDELARRIRAARAYAGFEKQDDLGRLLKEDGFGLTDVGRLERPHGKKRPPRLTTGRVDSLVKHTGLPREFFTEEQFGLSRETEDRALSQRLDLLTEAVERLAIEALEKDERETFQQWLTTDPRFGEQDPGGANP